MTNYPPQPVPYTSASVEALVNALKRALKREEALKHELSLAHADNKHLQRSYDKMAARFWEDNWSPFGPR